MNQLFSIILALAIALNGQVSQTGVRIEVDPADNPLNITGQIGELITLVGNVRLTARGGEVKEFFFLPSDLKRSNGDEVIGRQNVKLVGSPRLAMDTPKDFQVSVSGIEIPGEYQGQIQLMLPGQTITQAVSIKLEVTALAKPTLAALPGSEQVKLRLVQCQGLDCNLAGLFLPASAFLDRYELQFDNPSQSDVTITDAKVVGRGEFTGYPLTLSQLGLPATPYVLPAGKTGSITVTLNRDLIPPDHYAGTVYLTMQGRSEHLTFPVDLNMRTGPFWAIVLLLIGIVLGRLFKYLLERSQPPSEALKAANQLEYRVKQAHPDDQKTLEGQADDRITQTVQPAEDASSAAAAADQAESDAAAVATPAEPLPTAKSVWLLRIKGWLLGLSGSSGQIKAETTPWIVRPLLYFALLIGLLVVGLNALYIDKGLTFGANPLTDYFALVFWGLSADVASRTLSNLQSLKPMQAAG